MNPKKLLIIIPAYNEEEKIVETIKNIPKQIKGIDIIHTTVIDDGSTDRTASEVKEKTNAEIISFGKNKGLGFAFRRGLDIAIEGSFDIMVNIDADGQFDPGDISKIIEPILDNRADFVTASRFKDPKMSPAGIPKIKNWGNKRVAEIVNRLTKNNFSDVSCGFRAYGKEAILSLNLFGDFTYTQETFLDLSFKNLRIEEVPVNVLYFNNRKSRIVKNIGNYAWNISKIILKIYRDYNPLRFFSVIGLYVFLLGAILDIAVLIHFFWLGSFTPYKSVILIGGFLNFVGFIFFVFAFMSDMLYRMRINQEKILYYEKRRLFEKK